MATLLCTSRSRAKIRIRASGLFPLSTLPGQQTTSPQGRPPTGSEKQEKTHELKLDLKMSLFVLFRSSLFVLPSGCFISKPPLLPDLQLLGGATTHGTLCRHSRTSAHAVPRLHAHARRVAHGDQTSARARHAGGQSSPADLVGQAVRLRGLLQASPQVCQGVTQVCQGLLVVHSPGGGGGGDLLPGYFLVMPHNARGVHREG